MTPQLVLMVVGIVLLVAAAALAGAAVWSYRALDIKGVRDDLSGVARARETSASPERARRTTARAFSGASWKGDARRSAHPDEPDVAPTAHVPRPVEAPPPLRGTRTSESPPRAGAHAPAPPADEETSLLGEGTPQDSPPFEFRVTRKVMGTGTPERIEE